MIVIYMNKLFRPSKNGHVLTTLLLEKCDGKANHMPLLLTRTVNQLPKTWKTAHPVSHKRSMWLVVHIRMIAAKVVAMVPLSIYTY